MGLCMVEDRITEALRQIYEGEVRVHVHKGRITKIPAQVITLQARNSIQTRHEIVEDIEQSE